MTYEPEVGHLVRRDGGTTFRTVLLAGTSTSCASQSGDQCQPGVIWPTKGMIRVCPDCSQDWGDGETCQVCAPPAPPWVPRRGDWAVGPGGWRVTVLTASASSDVVSVWDCLDGRRMLRRISDLRPDPDGPVRCDPEPVAWVNLYPSPVGPMSWKSEEQARYAADVTATDVAVPLYRAQP